MNRAPMLFGAGVVALALSLTVAAQDGTKKTKGQLPAGWKSLGLTAAQKEKVYEVQASYRTRINALKAQITKLESERRAALLQVLTAEQKAKLSGTTPEPKKKKTAGSSTP